MSKLNIAEIRAVAEKATPGPWWYDRNETIWGGAIGRNAATGKQIVHDDDMSFTLSPENAAFIAASREWVPALCDRVEELEKQLAVKNAEITGLNGRVAESDSLLADHAEALRDEKRECATLRRALEMACNDAADEQCPNEFDLYTCEKCADCTHESESHTDGGRDAQCWFDYFIQQAQEEK